MKKKGFTLVELLAVIVILAIVALVVVPVVMGVIKDARKKSAIESFRGYMDAVEKTIIRDSMKTTSELPEKDSNGCYNLNELNPKIKVKGEKPVIDDSDDKLCVENGKIKSISEIEVKGYILEYKDGDIYVNGQNTSVQINSIEITNENKTVYIGKTLELQTKIEPTNGDTRNMKYKSSDESVATVDNKGVVTGVSKGNVTITVTARNGKKASIELRIKREVQSISITNSETELKEEETLQLTTSLTPSDADTELTWKSSNTGVATVSNSGLVTGKNIGSVTITVTTKNNKTATKSLTIKDACGYTVNQQFTFDYTGGAQELKICKGRYKLEVYGAQGGAGDNGGSGKGKGGYSYGTITSNKIEKYYIYVGGKGSTNSNTSCYAATGGWNGGGRSGQETGESVGAGGGATDIRCGGTSLYRRVIVAGGGGGDNQDGGSTTNSLGGGGLNQNSSASSSYGTFSTCYKAGVSTKNAPGGIQSGYTAGGVDPTFGNGGYETGCNGEAIGGGGGGWYGGAAVYDTQDGQGGLGWLYTAAAYNTWKSTTPSDANKYELDSSYYLTDTGGTNGNRSGNGYARITYLGK